MSWSIHLSGLAPLFTSSQWSLRTKFINEQVLYSPLGGPHHPQLQFLQLPHISSAIIPETDGCNCIPIVFHEGNGLRLPYSIFSSVIIQTKMTAVPLNKCWEEKTNPFKKRSDTDSPGDLEKNESLKSFLDRRAFRITSLSPLSSSVDR